MKFKVRTSEAAVKGKLRVVICDYTDGEQGKKYADFIVNSIDTDVEVKSNNPREKVIILTYGDQFESEWKAIEIAAGRTIQISSTFKPGFPVKPKKGAPITVGDMVSILSMIDQKMGLYHSSVFKGLIPMTAEDVIVQSQVLVSKDSGESQLTNQPEHFKGYTIDGNTKVCFIKQGKNI